MENAPFLGRCVDFTIAYVFFINRTGYVSDRLPMINSSRGTFINILFHTKSPINNNTI